MITEFGKILRIYRMDNGLLLKDMADALKVPSSYLSAMEMGRKAVTKEFVSQLFLCYKFTEEERAKLQKAAKDTVASVRINLENASKEKRNMALSFARKFEDIDEVEVNKIIKILNRGEQV